MSLDIYFRYWNLEVAKDWLKGEIRLSLLNSRKESYRFDLDLVI